VIGPELKAALKEHGEVLLFCRQRMDGKGIADLEVLDPSVWKKCVTAEGRIVGYQGAVLDHQIYLAASDVLRLKEALDFE